MSALMRRFAAVLCALVAFAAPCVAPSADILPAAVAVTARAVTSHTVSSHTVTSYASIPGLHRFSPGTSREVIVVSSASWSSTTGSLSAYARGANGRWVRVHGPYVVRLGRHGDKVASTRHEGDGTTPAGDFSITSTFGRLANPGTAMPYRKVSSTDYWVDDSGSRYYNGMRSSTLGGFRTSVSEHLIRVNPQYDYAAVVNFNRPNAVPGRGSGIFLHISVGSPTSGCVAATRAHVVTLLRWMRPSLHPRIVIGPSSWLDDRV